jgi:predicted  nucleic acid-binding Zn-ribbon protein
MASAVPSGSDVSAGIYRCTECGNELDLLSSKHLGPCPACGNGEYVTLGGADSVDDPSP